MKSGLWPKLNIQPVLSAADFFVDQGMILDSRGCQKLYADI